MSGETTNRLTTDLLAEAYHLAGGVLSMHDLYDACVRHFENTRKDLKRDFNPEDPNLLLNRVAKILTEVDPKSLKASDQALRYNLLKKSSS